MLIKCQEIKYQSLNKKHSHTTKQYANDHICREAHKIIINIKMTIKTQDSIKQQNAHITINST